MGLAYRDQGRFDAALGCFEQCLLAFRQVGDRLGEAKTLNSIGEASTGRVIWQPPRTPTRSRRRSSRPSAR